MSIILLGITIPEGQKIYVTEGELTEVTKVYHHNEMGANFVIYQDMFLVQLSDNITDVVIEQSSVIDCTRMSNHAFFESFSSSGDFIKFLILNNKYELFETKKIEEDLKKCYVNESVFITNDPLNITCFYHPGVGFINDALGHAHLIEKMYKYTPEFIIRKYCDVESFKMYLNEFLNIQSFYSARPSEFVHLEFYTLNKNMREDILKIFKYADKLSITQHFLNDFDNILQIVHVSDLNNLKDADKLPEYFVVRKPYN